MATLASDLALALDPARLLAGAGIVPDAWQASVLRSTARRQWLNWHRQSGKSTIVAAKGLHVALYEPEVLVLLLSPTLRQSAELFRKAAQLYSALGAPVPSRAESSLRLELENGSRLISLPGQEATIRGYSSVRLLAIDEAARVPDALYFAVLPMLAASRGDLIAMSTPWGRRGWWYEASRTGAWERSTLPAGESGRIGAADLDEAQRSMGAYWYAQEFQCAFMDAETAAFRSEDIERAFSQEVATWAL